MAEGSPQARIHTGTTTAHATGGHRSEYAPGTNNQTMYI